MLLWVQTAAKRGCINRSMQHRPILAIRRKFCRGIEVWRVQLANDCTLFYIKVALGRSMALAVSKLQAALSYIFESSLLASIQA